MNITNKFTAHQAEMIKQEFGRGFGNKILTYFDNHGIVKSKGVPYPVTTIFQFLNGKIPSKLLYKNILAAYDNQVKENKKERKKLDKRFNRA